MRWGTSCGTQPYIQRGTALFWTTPPTLSSPCASLTAFWCTPLFLFEKIWKQWGKVEKRRGGGGDPEVKLGNEKFDSFLDSGWAIFRWVGAHQRVLLHRLLHWQGGKTATSNWENWETARGSSPLINQNIQHSFSSFLEEIKTLWCWWYIKVFESQQEEEVGVIRWGDGKTVLAQASPPAELKSNPPPQQISNPAQPLAELKSNPPSQQISNPAQPPSRSQIQPSPLQSTAFELCWNATDLTTD